MEMVIKRRLVHSDSSSKFICQKPIKTLSPDGSQIWRKGEMNIDHMFYNPHWKGCWEMNNFKSYGLIQCFCVFPGNSRLMGLGNMFLAMLIDKTKLLSQKPAHVTCVITSPPPHHLFFFYFPLLSCPFPFSLYKPTPFCTCSNSATSSSCLLSHYTYTVSYSYSVSFLPTTCPPLCHFSLTLLSVMTASWFTPVMLNVSPVSPSRMVYSSLAFSPRSASVAEIRPISAPGMANSETEKDHIPERDTWRHMLGKRCLFLCADKLHLPVNFVCSPPVLSQYLQYFIQIRQHLI